MFLEVIKARYLADYKVLLDFNNGTSVVVNLENELDGPVFQPLKDKNYFKTFTVRYNTIEWDNGADFAPEFLYEIGEKMKNSGNYHRHSRSYPIKG
ncbi:MAG: DUF2442 domain-containing protein [Candidatus Omnitrophica bacterium]|nr:DUF2442 domain-containing protein [Candidatus Omnitrophota bacterium]